MLKKIKQGGFIKLLVSATAGFGVSACSIIASTSPASALDLFGFQQYRGTGQPGNLFGGQNAVVPQIINLMLFIVSILSVIMLIYGGIRYVLSSGDAGRVKDAKNTVLYAIIGLVVAIFAYAIINWVIQVVGAGASGSSASV